MFGTIKSQIEMLWMLLRGEKFQQNAPLAEALKGGLETWWLLWSGQAHRLLESERKDIWHHNDAAMYKLIAKKFAHFFIQQKTSLVI